MSTMGTTVALIRAFEEGDLPLVLSTWCDSYANGSWFAKPVSRPVFFKGHRRALRALMQRPAVRLHVAHNPRDPSDVYAWSCTERDVLHFAYVKPAWRHLGLARALTAHLPALFRYSHLTHAATRTLAGLRGRATYDPFLLFDPVEEIADGREARIA